MVRTLEAWTVRAKGALSQGTEASSHMPAGLAEVIESVASSRRAGSGALVSMRPSFASADRDIHELDGGNDGPRVLRVYARNAMVMAQVGGSIAWWPERNYRLC